MTAMTFMAYGIPILLAVACLSFPRSRVVTAAWMAYAFILVGLNTHTPDFYNYLQMYQLAGMVAYSEIEPGYRLLCIVLHSAGVSFQVFRMIIAVCYIFLTYKAVAYYTSNVNYALGLLLIFPLLPYISGLRFTLASAIVCFGIRYLSGNHRKGKLKYAACIAIAAMFHYSVLFYLVFLLIRIDSYQTLDGIVKPKRQVNLIVVVTIAICISALLYTPIPIWAISLVTDNSRFYQWLDLHSTVISHLNFVGVAANVICQAGTVVLLWLNTQACRRSVKILGAKQMLSESHIDRIRAVQLIRDIGVLTLLVTPAYIITSEYQRLYLGILPIIYAGFACAKSVNTIKCEHSYSLVNLLELAWVIILLAFFTYQIQSYNVFATLTDNLVFSGVN